MTSTTSSGRSGSGLTGREAPRLTVMTRLRLKQTMPGRSARRRQARTARKAAGSGHRSRVMGWLRKEAPRTATRINPDRDRRARASGRLRKELQ